MICVEFVYLYFPVLFCLSVSVKWLAVKTASEMTYTVSGGALNSTQTKTKPSVCDSNCYMVVWYFVDNKVKLIYLTTSQQLVTVSVRNTQVIYFYFSSEFYIFEDESARRMECMTAWNNQFVHYCQMLTNSKKSSFTIKLNDKFVVK